MNNPLRSLLRKIVHRPWKFLPQSLQWRLLRHYPHVRPTRNLLNRWQRSEWAEYQTFIEKKSICTIDHWQQMHSRTLAWKIIPKISIITPVYNTPPNELHECIQSVRMQTCPFWELILADDGSTREDTLRILHSSLCRDPRIKILFAAASDQHGISAASNRAVEAATGDFLLFLDHDDRLAPEAVQQTLFAIKRETPMPDILYSDRDMISPTGNRHMHLMKPDWSPETLLSCNYIVHFMCFRTSMVRQVGGFQSRLDGSQDYDLILRCTEKTQNIKHIPEVLYHWRQSKNSVSLSNDAKRYAFIAAEKAIAEALTRRGIKAQVRPKAKIPGLYDILFPSTDSRRHFVSVQPDNPASADRIGRPQQTMKRATSARAAGRQAEFSDMDNGESYVRTVNSRLRGEANHEPLLLLANSYTPRNDALAQMSSWMGVKGIGMVCGRVVSVDNILLYGGMIFRRDATVCLPYAGDPADRKDCYLSATGIMRNISAPWPFCVMINRQLFQELQGLDDRYLGPYGLLDFGLRALTKGYRILYLPAATFVAAADGGPGLEAGDDLIIFRERWAEYLRWGDPLYNRNLSPQSSCYELQGV